MLFFVRKYEPKGNNRVDDTLIQKGFCPKIQVWD